MVFSREHIRRASTLLTQHHGYHVPFRPGFPPKGLLYRKNDAARKNTETFQTDFPERGQQRRNTRENKITDRQTITTNLNVRFNGLYSSGVMFCFYKHNVAFVPRYKGIDELKET